jgi:hypothetical protein
MEFSFFSLSYGRIILKQTEISVKSGSVSGSLAGSFQNYNRIFSSSILNGSAIVFFSMSSLMFEVSNE